MTKRQKKRKKGMSQQDMQYEATQIFNAGKNKIQGVNKYTWKVESRSSPNTWHTVKMSKGGLECTCAYYQKRKAICAHAMAIEMLILQKAFKMKSGSKKVVIQEKIPIQCPHGHTDKINRDGKRNRIYRNPAQRYECGTCGTRFTWDVIGFAGMHYSPKAILLALSLFVIGTSPADIALVLKQNMDIIVYESSIQRWAERYITLVELYTKDLPIRTGGKWSVDEKKIRIVKKGHWLFTMMDQYTRFLLASHVSSKKDKYNANQLFKSAAKRADCTPAILKSDSLPAFKSACKNVYRVSYGASVLHWCDCHIRGIFKENNGHERLNSTWDGLIRTKRSLKSVKSVIVRAALLHYNFCRPHYGINKKTPAEAANIIIQGNNTWQTLIQNAILEASKKT